MEERINKSKLEKIDSLSKTTRTEYTKVNGLNNNPISSFNANSEEAKESFRIHR